jgi:hypothetical protein
MDWRWVKMKMFEMMAENRNIRVAKSGNTPGFHCFGVCFVLVKVVYDLLISCRMFFLFLALSLLPYVALSLTTGSVSSLPV